MADWEQRLRLYAATSNSRRGTSPSSVITSVPLTPHHDPVPPVSSPSLHELHSARAKSPNALERLRASTAMNLVALELRRSESAASTSTARRAGNSPTRAPVGSSPLPAPLPSASILNGWGSESVSSDVGVAAGRTPTVPSGAAQAPTNLSLSGNDVYFDARSPNGYPPMPRSNSPHTGSFYAQSQQQHPSTMPPLEDRGSPKGPTTAIAPLPPPSISMPQAHLSLPRTGSPNRAASSTSVGSIPAAVMADSFNPQTILQMLETKLRTLEAKNMQLDSTVQTLTARNQELTAALADAEVKVRDHVALQAAAAGMQHEVERLREEVAAISAREERRLEELRSRFTAELEEERRCGHLRNQELLTLRSGIQQLANLERSGGLR